MLSRRYTHWLGVRVTSDERERVERIASARGMRISEVLRDFMKNLDEDRPIAPRPRAAQEAGRTLQELAFITGISRRKLSAADRRLVRLTRAEKRVLAEALNLDEQDLDGVGI
jgi:hypothetical protein